MINIATFWESIKKHKSIKAIYNINNPALTNLCFLNAVNNFVYEVMSKTGSQRQLQTKEKKPRG